MFTISFMASLLVCLVVCLIGMTIAGAIGGKEVSKKRKKISTVLAVIFLVLFVLTLGFFCVLFCMFDKTTEETTTSVELVQCLDVSGINLSFSEFDNIETVKFTQNEENYTFNYVERDKSKSEYTTLLACKSQVGKVIGIFNLVLYPRYTCELT